MIKTVFEKKCWARLFLSVIAGWLFTGGIVATPCSLAATTLTITKAQWEDSRSRLDVAGQATVGAIVVVLDGETLLELGSTTVRRSGSWRLRLRGLSTAPCNIQAESGGQIQDKDVSNAPSECAAIDPPPTVSLIELTCAR